jgi:hypothetical protein
VVDRRRALHRSVVIPPINTTLCNFIAGMATATASCTTVPQADWFVPPDALCSESGCVTTCDPATTCNAWALQAEFAAHGVEIDD